VSVTVVVVPFCLFRLVDYRRLVVRDIPPGEPTPRREPGSQSAEGARGTANAVRQPLTTTRDGWTCSCHYQNRWGQVADS